MKFGLSEEDYAILDKLLIVPLKNKNATVWVFGSRARGDNAKYSDIDILFESSDVSPIEGSYLYQIKSDLEDSDLPVKVDVVDIKDLADSYRDNVLRERIEL